MQERDENAGTGEDFENIPNNNNNNLLVQGRTRTGTPLLMGEAICHVNLSHLLGVESMAGVSTNT